VTTAYRIKDVADRSGFSAATLRYYEEIGLLPEPARTQAGYRLYDDHTLSRLAFIARAKRIGCTLDEIADLTIAWDGGQCGPVQDRLRTVVADKLAGTRQQIVDLMTLTSDLQHAAADLERHRPQGPCDDQCGCVTTAAEDTTTTAASAVSLIAKPAKEDDAAPIACTLSPDSLHGRLDEWNTLLTHVERREPIDGGARATFDGTTPLSDLLLLVAAEQECCQFLKFAITVDTRGIALEIRAPDDALPIIESLFGTPT
jgi:MerR family copper efflux transcriptional regulator